MEAYTAFAEVYDAFMDNIPYGEWADYVQSLLTEYGVRDGLVLELGSGTGNLTELLASMGYDMIGVDCSGDMLGTAMEKREASGIFTRICGSLSFTARSGPWCRSATP